MLQKNKIIDVGDGTCVMELCDSKRECIANTIFSTEDKSKIENRRWRLDGCGYAGDAEIRLHSIIIGQTKGKEVDHIDGNRLNNTRSNLRLVTRQQNTWNKKYVGVHRHSTCDRWVVQIKVDNKTLHLGLFKTKEEALKVRKGAETKF